MSTLLYKLGKSAYSKPWPFLIGWIAVLGIIVAMLAVNGIHSGSELKIAGTQSQKVLDQLTSELPEAAGGQASVVFVAPAGERLDTPERLPIILKAIQDVYELEYVMNPIELAAKAGMSAAEQLQAGAGAMQANPAASPSLPYGPLMMNGMPIPGVMLSSSGNIALFQFQFTVQQMSLPKHVPHAVIDTVSIAEQNGSGITVIPSDSLKSTPAIGSTEAIGLLVAVVVLLITLGSIVAAGLPLITALVGIAISIGGAFAISKFIEMNDITPVLAIMIGLAVGIDYSLFIVNRQRRIILDQRLDAREAASRAVGTAGSAVFFAGLTVIIALCGMLIIGIEFLSTMALVAGAAVAISVLLALTLLPALLGLVGERICSPKARENGRSSNAAAKRRRSFSDRWVNAAVHYRWLIIVGVVALLGTAAIPAAQMELGIPSGSSANLDTPARQSYDAITEGFGEGFNGPLLLVAEPQQASERIAPEKLMQLLGQLQMLDNVALVTPMGVNPSGDIAIISLIPQTGPTDPETRELVQHLRSEQIAQAVQMKLGVTGFTAINIDMSSKLSEAFPVYIGIIVMLSVLILMLVFRSIIVPVKATVGFILSILATFGITTAVFQWGWLHSLFGFDTGGPLLSFMPILVTGILYGLAMDYQVFLVSSMRESYVHGNKGTASVVQGFNMASSIVLAAAVIMVSVFAGFIFAHDIMIKQIGFALAIGILLDAFLVRMTLIPAVMAVFGDKAWWLPRWLNRLLPNLDVEGDKLISRLKSAKDA